MAGAADHARMKRLIAQLIKQQAPVHMIGVGGVGMAGVARLLKARGVPVSGCDVARGPLSDELADEGLAFESGHGAEHLDKHQPRWVIHTAAIGPEHEELLGARASGLPVFRRGEVLPVLMTDWDCSIAVAGSHGKTTTTTFIAQLLRGVGVDLSWCIGGASDALGTVAHAGRDAVLVAETDESDGTLSRYEPDLAVVTNVEFDHMEHFASVDAFENCFATFMRAARRRVLYNGDDPRASQLAHGLANALSFGLGADAQLRVDILGDGRLKVSMLGQCLGELPVVLKGTHNVMNLLAAVGVCLEYGIAFDLLVAAAQELTLPRRRYETVCEYNGIRVISDYAHHPTEVASLLRMARDAHRGRLVAVFQPHRYTRTAALGADFPAAFKAVDTLVLVPVYAASEKPLPGGLISDLYARFRESREGPTPLLATSLSQAWGFLRCHLCPGDCLLVIGAGDVEKIAQWAKQEAQQGGWHQTVGAPSLSPGSTWRTNEPLGVKTTYRVGGLADYWVAADNEADAANVFRFCREKNLPLHILGAGSNILVSDLGVRGVVMRLTGDDFQRIRREASTTVIAGGAVSLAHLHDYLTREGLAGLTFLEGVPGGVGGIVRMNGGAYGHEVRERILWIRGLNPNGEMCIVQADALEWGYRGCESLRGFLVFEVAFKLEYGDSNQIRSQRLEIQQKRAWMRGLHCSGSVFRNPKGDYAGRRIEKAALKGVRIGGAVVLPRHGNFVVAEEAGATASDVLALIQRIEDVVARSSGEQLVREVVCLM